MATLTVRIKTKDFGRGRSLKPLLHSVNFALQPGEVAALIGPSGIGKTTLLNMVAGLEPVGEGTIERHARRLAYVFQEPRLLPWRRVIDNVRIVLDGHDAERHARQMLAGVGLTEAADTFASRLSLGMARRVGLARAFVIEPDLLLLDEPFVSLDEPTALRLQRLLLTMLQERRPSALFVTHRLEEAVMLSHRLLVLGGRPATLRADVPVPLDPEARRDADAVAACTVRLKAAYPALVADAEAEAAA